MGLILGPPRGQVSAADETECQEHCSSTLSDPRSRYDDSLIVLREGVTGIDIENVNAVVMAKYPEPGRTKTRLISDSLSAETASEIALAMLQCMIERLGIFGQVTLGVTPDGFGAAMSRRLGSADIRIVDQGPGDLGERLDRVWNLVGIDQAIAFFGMDSPDIPFEMLKRIPVILDNSDLALGATEDGGYWTLVARRYAPQVLRNIDWGSESVYHQTCQQAEDAGYSLEALPIWPDVDEPEDLMRLRNRLAESKSTTPKQDAALPRLACRLDELLDLPEPPENS